jgi:WD40 repeat protein
VPRVSGAQASLRIAHTTQLGSWVRDLSWHPDGRRIAVACAEGQVLAGAADGANAEPVHEHAGGVLAVTYSPDGVLASGGQDGRLVIAGTERQLGSGWVEHLAWRPDGARLAETHRRQVSFWTADGQLANTARELPPPSPASPGTHAA